MLKELQVRSAARSKEGQNTAYFCIWGVRDDRGTGWLKGAFNKSIQDRGPKSKANQKIVVVWMHDILDPIGRPLEIVEDDLGAYAVIEWDDPEAVPNAKRAMSQIRSGTLNGWSFGFDYIYDKMKYDEDVDTIWISEAELFEISPITFASMKETFTVRSKQDFESAKMLLDEETQIVLQSLPKIKQLEVRQLLTKHVSLAKVEPDTLEHLKSKTLKLSEPKDSIITDLAKYL